MTKEVKRHFYLFMIGVGLIALISLGIQFYQVNAFNSELHTVTGCDAEEESYMDIANRADSTSTWMKRDFELNDKSRIDLIGATIDGKLHNASPYQMSEWSLRVNIKGDCYINSAWCGTVEIHQNADTPDEIVQTLDLRNYDLRTIDLDYLYDGDLLIPLKAGDYIMYNPSVEEMPMDGHSDLTMGVIFYYTNSVDLTDYTLEYYYHKDMQEGIWFIMFILFGLTLLGTIATYVMYIRVYKKAEEEMEHKISGISCMSEIYSTIYMIDIEKDYLTPISASEKAEELRPKDIGANAQLMNMFDMFSTEGYKELMYEFAELSTLNERMKDKNSISYEFLSNQFGWSRVQFIVMDRKPGKPIEKVLFTIQDIDETKREMDEIQSKVLKAESENLAKSTFLANMSHEIRTPINTVLGLDTMILRESNEDNVRAYARDIKHAGNMLLSLINGILDFSKLEAGRMELVPAEYSIKELIFDIRSIIKTKVDAKNLDFSIEVTDKTPEKLYGDDVRIKQIIINLLTNAVKYTEKGSVKLSVICSEENEGKVKLSVSVQDTGMGIREEDRAKLTERFARLEEDKNRNIEGTGIGINLVCGLLELMDSELKVDSVYGEGSNFYFDIYQEVVSAEPIGQVDWEAGGSLEDDEYSVSFTAPNATVLVVDDNEMNLMVFENLLKETELNIDRASSGFAALELTKEKKYDIIFMDHMMPEMNGVETFNRIKVQEGGQNPDTPVIILTANALQGAKEEYDALGFTDFIPKPIQPEHLESKIMEYLPEEKCNKAVTKGASEKKAAGTGLPDIEGVDGAYAIQHMGSADGAIKVMKQFVTVADSDADELLGFYEAVKADPANEDALANYRIKVHAMKTSAGLCGALQVYGVAAWLEHMARENKGEQVVEITPYFIEFWKRLRDSLKAGLGLEDESDKNKKQMDKTAFANLLHQLVTAMNAYDIKTADNIVNELEGYELDSETSEKMAKLKTAVANLDAPECEKICGGMK